jgi:hypothetical protein
MMSGLFLRMVLAVFTCYSITWLPYIHDLFLLSLVHAHTNVHFLILPLFPLLLLLLLLLVVVVVVLIFICDWICL